MFFLRGSGHLRFLPDRCEATHAVTLQTPCRVAVPIEVDGPLHCLGAVLSPLGWAAFTGLDAKRWGDRMLDAVDILGAEIGALGDSLAADYAESRFDSVGAAQSVAAFIANRLKPINPGHIRLLGQVTEFLSTSLSPPIEALYEVAGYSPRQVQRLFDRYFGVSPSEVVRRYRALRAVTMLSDPGLTAQAAVAIAESFYDQSHMIREIRMFAWRTPMRREGQETPILDVLLDTRNYRDVTPNIAPLPHIATAKDSD